MVALGRPSVRDCVLLAVRPPARMIEVPVAIGEMFIVEIIGRMARVKSIGAGTGQRDDDSH